nr:nascent polypeptide-associated complex subunit alpha, muscle-specific form-like [Aegilops tauschii subsp. strangulata]
MPRPVPAVAHSPLDLDRDRGLDPPSSSLPPHPRRLAPWPDRPRPPLHRASTPSPLDTDRRPTLPRRSPELLRLVRRPVLVSPSTAPPSHAYPLLANAGEGLALPLPLSRTRPGTVLRRANTCSPRLRPRLATLLPCGSLDLAAHAPHEPPPAARRPHRARPQPPAHGRPCPTALRAAPASYGAPLPAAVCTSPCRTPSPHGGLAAPAPWRCLAAPLPTAVLLPPPVSGGRYLPVRPCLASSP